jgi:hypothetical protein
LEPPPLFTNQQRDSAVIRGLAEAFLSGPWDPDRLVARGGRILGRRYRWLRPLARRVLAAYPANARPRVARLAAFLGDDVGFRRARRRHSLGLHFDGWPEPAMTPAPGPPGSWPVPAIATLAELARFLELEPGELDWFADCQARERHAPTEPLRHYRYQ